MKMSVSKKILVPSVLQQIWKSEECLNLNNNSIVNTTIDRYQMSPNFSFGTILDLELQNSSCSEREVDFNLISSLIKQQTESLKKLNKKFNSVSAFYQNVKTNIQTVKRNQQHIIDFVQSK
ncbi:Hypothetical_protein [Hexamita inflata]|uniref:Hypothetical_protein n=1 Tax=Hexamita inflata TaxID=28002 RepID=A0AA86REG2_9EUKA|nr:Hypothetical protein HINF_LOCUS34116 [Hexamita inflata]CAI9973223.1 Hypothetical protein HINF_LOCUS60868 [Hexamita inflata]